ncbi:PEP-utilizing enzyme [Fundidesulfovibrio terrae]|uniref:PEP-utilizing enzyme n=1 Tax=Fundidesulfovibrio terrae TaxID=2922866 RepID=UPI001FAFDC39|nr:PEP-utilizing enzyme [Fundidesulfovibrio terrae]
MGKAGSRQDEATGPGSARFLLRTFKRILECNTLALERMAQMDRALGGEYVFDKAFLESAARDVCSLTHRTAYHLNGMADEGYVDLYDAYLRVKDALEDVLSGGMGPLAGRRVLPFSEIGWEMEPLVGLCNVGLAVLGARMGLPAPDGLAVTVTGMAGLSGTSRDEILAEMAHGVGDLFTRAGGRAILELSLVDAGSGGAGKILATAQADSPGSACEAVLAFAAGDADAPGEAGTAAGTGAPGTGGLAGSPGISRDARPQAVCIRLRPEAAVIGTLQTLAFDPNLPPSMLLSSRAPAGPALPDRCWLSRSAPHDPLRSRISPKEAGTSLPGGDALSVSSGRRLRGSAWLLPAQTALLAELGLAAERALGGPCVLSFVLTPRGRVRITAIEPITTPYPEWIGAEGQDELELPDEGDIILDGGQIACGGVGAGPVVPIDDDTLPDSVPLGAVGVARAASPALSRIVPRLGALLAEVGTAASHLATVARENRVPAVFGLKGAAALEAGSMVTVDADQGAVYRGVAESLLRQAALQGAQTGTEPEYLVLRRLLRHIRPLNLVDPQSRDFDAAHCRTCHDILHFAHEKAVDLLLSMGTPGQNGLGQPRRLEEDSPFALGIVDVGGGLAGVSGPVTLADVESEPLRAFLEGLLLKDVRRDAPARLSLGDIMGGIGRTSQALSADPASAGLNLAIAARDYANVTLRLGYHFSVVDAVVSPRPEHTFVYFRFAGGFADNERRARRAGLLLNVLERLGFRATRKGDLVVGKRKLMEAPDALETLRFLGALTAYTRQLDVELVSDVHVEHFTRRFLEASGLDVLHSGEAR